MYILLSIKSQFINKERGITMEFETIVKIVAEFTSVDESEIEMDTKFVDDLGVDSLDLVQIIMALEEEYDIEINNEDAEKIVAIGDAVEAIKTHVNND